ncbi:hypothetical protein Trydic_g17316 [Trypoxylus dichotomus]
MLSKLEDVIRNKKEVVLLGAFNARNVARPTELDRRDHHNGGDESAKMGNSEVGSAKQPQRPRRERGGERRSSRGADWEKFEGSVRESVEQGPQTRESEGQSWQEVATAKANKSRRKAQGERDAGARERKIQAQESWGKAYKIWREQKAKEGGMENICRSNGSWTGSVDETIEALFDKYFPRNQYNGEDEETEGVGEVPQNGTEEPKFSAGETKEAASGRQMSGNTKWMPGERRFSRSMEEDRGDTADKTGRRSKADKSTTGIGEGAG